MNFTASFRRHWPEYLIEAWALGTFLISAALITAALEFPGSPVHQAIPDAFTRRALIGLAMGLTAIAIIYSPWGQRSGAHLNPAVTLTFLQLGKISPWDAAGYVVAQFVGGTIGLSAVKALVPGLLAHPSVNYVATTPGPAGQGVAFLAETAMAFGMMLMVLKASNTPRLAGCTGLFAGTMVFLYITFEAPISGMSLNPARTFASALPSGIWTGGWIYFTAPLLGMTLAAQSFVGRNRTVPRACPKLHHGRSQRCIFCRPDPVAGAAAGAGVEPAIHPAGTGSR